jgi:hypothetical protein
MSRLPFRNCIPRCETNADVRQLISQPKGPMSENSFHKRIAPAALYALKEALALEPNGSDAFHS